MLVKDCRADQHQHDATDDFSKFANYRSKHASQHYADRNHYSRGQADSRSGDQDIHVYKGQTHTHSQRINACREGGDSQYEERMLVRLFFLCIFMPDPVEIMCMPSTNSSVKALADGCCKSIVDMAKARKMREIGFTVNVQSGYKSTTQPHARLRHRCIVGLANQMVYAPRHAAENVDANAQ